MTDTQTPERAKLEWIEKADCCVLGAPGMESLGLVWKSASGTFYNHGDDGPSHAWPTLEAAKAAIVQALRERYRRELAALDALEGDSHEIASFIRGENTAIDVLRRIIADKEEKAAREWMSRPTFMAESPRGFFEDVCSEGIYDATEAFRFIAEKLEAKARAYRMMRLQVTVDE